MSPRFKFKFDKVLRHREVLEQKESKLFAELTRQYDGECRKSENLKAKYKGSQRELSQKEKKGIDIDELKSYYTYLNSLKLDINLQKIKVKEAEAKKEAQRKKLVEAQKKKKVMDKLKENKYNEYKEKERKDDLKILDDINSITTARSRRAE